MKQTQNSKFFNTIAGKQPCSPAQTIKLAATVHLKGGEQERVLLSTNEDIAKVKMPRNKLNELASKKLIEGAENLSAIQ